MKRETINCTNWNEYRLTCERYQYNRNYRKYDTYKYPLDDGRGIGFTVGYAYVTEYRCNSKAVVIAYEDRG